MTKQALEARLHSEGVKGKCWGRIGQASVLEIEAKLGLSLPSELAKFAAEVGNVIIGPFNMIVSGSEDGSINCATETAEIGYSIDPKIGPAVKILDHAGESYFYVSATESIKSYDSLNITAGSETGGFGSLSEFLDFLFEEAGGAERDIRFVGR